MSVPQPPFHSVSEELLYNIYMKFADTGSLKAEDINTFAKLNAILTDGDLIKAEEITLLVNALKGNVPEAGNSLEKLFNILQGIQFLKAEDIDTLAELNSIINDADILSPGDLANAINTLKGNVPANADTLEKLFNLTQGLNFLSNQDIDTLAELNAIITDADLVKTNDLTAIADGIKGNVPVQGDTLEKLYSIIQSLNFLKKEDIDTLAELNAIITDGILTSNTDVVNAINTLKGNVPSGGDTLEKLYNLVQGLNTLTTQDIDTIAELNAIITDADLVRTTDLSGLYNDRGNYNASVNIFPANGGSGSGGIVLKGNVWSISVAGTLGGTAVLPGQTVRALIDNPGQIAANWAISLFGSFAADGNLVLGLGLGGFQRTISAAGTQANVDIKIVAKNSGNIFLNTLGAVFINADLIINSIAGEPKLVLSRAEIIPNGAVINSIQLEGVSTNGQNRVFGRIDMIQEDGVNNIEYGKMDIKVISAGVEQSVLKFSGKKNLEAEFLGPVRLKPYTVATVPSANQHTGSMIYVSNEIGGATIAFSNGVNWLRVQDKTVIA